MRTVSGRPLSKIGIGSYGIGGRGHRDVELTEKLSDEKYIEALIYMLKKGINFTEISLGYGHGNAIRIFKQALDESAIDRKDIFITHSLYTRDVPTVDVTHRDIKDFYTITETNYADSTLVVQSLILKFGERVIYQILHKLLDSGKTRFVSLSNASPAWIKKFKQEFGDKFYAHEGHLSFEIRALQDKGIFDLCDQLGIVNNIWRPLARNATLKRNWPLLTELAEKYGKTQSQIILNWMCSLGYRPMVFSINTQHIDENFASIDFKMSRKDYQRMADFRPSNYHPSEINWEDASADDDIVNLIKDFDNQH